jgi:diguanylate cyclase
MQFSLHIKFGILLALFGFMASGVTGYYFYTASRSLMVREAERDLLNSTQVLGRRYSIALQEVANNVRLLAELPNSRLAGTGLSDRSNVQADALADIFSAMLSVHPEYFQIRLISAENHGIELVRVERDDNILVRVKAKDLQEKGHFPYVFRSLRLPRGEILLSKITINHELGSHSSLDKPTLRVATPVISATGKPLGVIVVNVDLNGLFSLLKTDLSPDYQLYLANEWGDFLIHPDPGQTFGFDRGRRILLQDSFEQARSLFEGRADSAVARLPADKSKELTATPVPVPSLATLAKTPIPLEPLVRGGGLVAAFHKLPFGDAAAGQFVVIGLSQPLDRVLGETRAMGMKTLQIVLAFSILAMLLSFAASRYLTRHLNMIVDAVKRFSREHVIGELPLGRNDEIGLLARSFNDMQREISAHMAELNESRQKMDHLARHDTLTGLPNRMMFFDTLGHEMAAMRRTGKQLAVFFIDLDRFKEINDSRGHTVGDEVLRVSARRLRGMVREVDTVARLGGDEFMILLCCLDDVQHLPAIAQKIIDGVSRPIEIGHDELQVSASIGISLYPRDSANAAELVHKADLAMYQSKTAGRNAYMFYADGMTPNG